MDNRGGLLGHEPHPMRVGLDVDDVLLNLTDRWLELYNEEWDDNLDRHDIHSWDFWKYVRSECGEKIYDFLTPGIYEKMEALKGAAEFVQSIRDLGHIPVYVSACGPPGGPQETAIAAAKMSSLLDLGIAQIGETFIGGRDKSNAPVDFLLDDGLHNVEEFRNGLAIIFTQPWNLSSHLTRARSYDDALSFIDTYARHRPLCEDFS